MAKRIGKRLGLDEAGVEENENDRRLGADDRRIPVAALYLSYGVGLFEPGEVIALRYKLSDDVGVHAARHRRDSRRRRVPHRAIGGQTHF